VLFRSNIDAYRTVGRAGEAEAQGLPLQPADPPRLLTGAGLSDEEWQAYLAQLPQEATCSS
jgi:hypothetical protein